MASTTTQRVFIKRKDLRHPEITVWCQVTTLLKHIWLLTFTNSWQTYEISYVLVVVFTQVLDHWGSDCDKSPTLPPVVLTRIGETHPSEIIGSTVTSHNLRQASSALLSRFLERKPKGTTTKTTKTMRKLLQNKRIFFQICCIVITSDSWKRLLS